MYGIPESPQYGAVHIVKAGEDNAEPTDHYVVIGLGDRFFRCMQKPEECLCKDQRDCSNDEGQYDLEDKQGTDDFLYFFLITRALCLGDQDLAGHGRADTGQIDQLHQLGAVRDGGEPPAAQELPDDDRIGRRIQGLEQGAEHEREREFKQGRRYAAFEQAHPASRCNGLIRCHRADLHFFGEYWNWLSIN